jgi:LmbE family N-acetylglucosaminyl deacetylase
VQADLNQVAARVAGYIRELQPEVVLTFDPIGGYKHPDHIAMHRATVVAFHTAGDPDAYPEQAAQNLSPHRPQKLYFTGLPRRALRWMVRLMPLLGRDPTAFGKNGDINLVEIAAVDFAITTRVDVGDYMATKQAAAACHRSQNGPGGLFDRLPGWLVRKIGSTESFTRAYPEVGPDEPVEVDLFSGVR